MSMSRRVYACNHSPTPFQKGENTLLSTTEHIVERFVDHRQPLPFF